MGLRLLAAACLFALASPALALVGPAREDEDYAAHLVMVLNRGVNKAGFCTGIVIAPRVILTAAHCIAAVGDMRVHYREASGQPILVEVAEVAVNPGFHADALVRRVASVDLALVRTRTSLPGRFSPAKLDDSGALAVGQSLRILGYGVGREGDGKSAGVLRSAALRVRAPLSAVLVWAEDPSGGGAGGCTGDSGGPILSSDNIVLAVTTWSAGTHGRHCGTITQGPLVAPQRDWIDGTLKSWGF